MSNKETNNECKYSLSSLDEVPVDNGVALCDLAIVKDDATYNPARSTQTSPDEWQDYAGPANTTYYRPPNNSENKAKIKKIAIWICVILVIACVAYSLGKKEGSELPPVAKPYSGAILSGTEYYNESEITITADSSHDYVVSLKDMRGREYVSFYVRAGDTVTVGVPAKWLYVYFASGKEWYGYGQGLMFGKNTDYSKDSEAKDFTQYTWSYKLYSVANGNFKETPSDADEFFS